MEEEEKKDGPDGLQQLFQTIYAGGDEVEVLRSWAPAPASAHPRLLLTRVCVRARTRDGP